MNNRHFLNRVLVPEPFLHFNLKLHWYKISARKEDVGGRPKVLSSFNFAADVQLDSQFEQDFRLNLDFCIKHVSNVLSSREVSLNRIYIRVIWVREISSSSLNEENIRMSNNNWLDYAKNEIIANFPSVEESDMTSRLDINGHFRKFVFVRLMVKIPIDSLGMGREI